MDHTLLLEARPWRSRVVVQVAVLATAAFIYVTAEMIPIGALPAIAADLKVSEPMVGSLLAVYAMVAAVATVPLVRWTAHWPRRRVLLVTLLCLTVSLLISALATDLWMLGAARVSAALTHGLMWAVVAPIAARLVPETHIGRATAAVHFGTGAALVVGNPLTAAMSQAWGWRLAVMVVAAGAAVITTAAWLTLPPMGVSVERLSGWLPPRHHRNRRLVSLSLLTLAGVTAHFISYTFIVLIVSDVVGVRGPSVGWLLAAYGVAGMAAVALLARPADRLPAPVVFGCLAAIVAAFAALTVLAMVGVTGVAASVAGAVAITAWGAAVLALAPVLQATVIRSSPDDPDGASGLYVAAFQMGIVVGALLGSLLYAVGGMAVVVGTSTVLMAAVLAAVAADRDLFRSPVSPHL